MKDNPGDSPPRTVEAVDLSVEILEALVELGSAGVTELANHVKRSKSGVYWHLVTLHEHGFVAKDESEYRLGHRFIEYGERTKRIHIRNYSEAKGELNRLVLESGEYVQMMIEDHGYGVFIWKSGGANAVGSDYRVGETQYLHASAAGKSILAHVPESRRTQIVAAKNLPSITASTITEVDALERELARIRDRGYALSDEETAVGIRAVGAVLRDRDSEVLGAISVSGPTSRFQGEYFEEELPASVMEAANVIEINHNYHT